MEESAKLFNEDNRLYKFYINSTVNDKNSIDFVKSLFKLELIDLDRSENQDLLQLYEILGFDKFFEVIAFFGSKTLKIPKLDKIKKLLITAIAYYQIEILNLSPKDAGKILSEKLGLLNLKQKNIKGLTSRLQQDIDYITNTTLRKMLAEEANKGGENE
jgi:hypothetical protein